MKIFNEEICDGMYDGMNDDMNSGMDNGMYDDCIMIS